MIDYLVTQIPEKDQAKYVDALALELDITLACQQSRADLFLLITASPEDKGDAMEAMIDDDATRNPFCRRCGEGKCDIRRDGTCAMIRRYLKGVDKK